MSDKTDDTGMTRRRILFAAPAVAFAGLAGLFLSRLGAGDASRVPSALVGREAPAMELPPLEGLLRGGKPVPGLTPDILRQSRVTLVNVWASWCGPCRIEHPILTDLAKQPGLQIVGINYKDQTENARRFLGALGNPYSAVGVDDAGRASIEWGVYGVPETFIVDGKGIVRHKHIGPLTQEALPGFLDRAKAASA